MSVFGLTYRQVKLQHPWIIPCLLMGGMSGMVWEDIARWRSGAIVSCAAATFPAAIGLLVAGGYIVHQASHAWSVQAVLVVILGGGTAFYGAYCMARDAVRAILWVRRGRTLSYD